MLMMMKWRQYRADILSPLCWWWWGDASIGLMSSHHYVDDDEVRPVSGWCPLTIMLMMMKWGQYRADVLSPLCWWWWSEASIGLISSHHYVDDDEVRPVSGWFPLTIMLMMMKWRQYRADILSPLCWWWWSDASIGLISSHHYVDDDEVRPVSGWYPRTIMLMMMSWCLMSSDVSWHIRDKLWPTPKHGSIILYVHGNQKAR